MNTNYLTEKQQTLLNFISSYIEENGFPPTREEIARHFNLKQKASIIHQLQALEKKGYIKIQKKVARGIEILNKKQNGIPIVGEIAAGSGLVAEENIIERWDPINTGKIPKNSFALQVRGESMIEAGIFEGDIVFVDPNVKPKDGDICAIIIEGEATIKHLFYNDEYIVLQPANKMMQKRIVDKSNQSLNIIGPVIAIWRQIKTR